MLLLLSRERKHTWQPVLKSRVAPRAARRLADKARRGSILDIFDRGATQFSRDASPLECSGAFDTGRQAFGAAFRCLSQRPVHV